MTTALASATVQHLAARIAWMDALTASIRAELDESRRQAAVTENRR